MIKFVACQVSESDGNNNEHDEDDVISQQEEEASLGSASIFSASDHTDGSDNDFSDHKHDKNQTSTSEKGGLTRREAKMNNHGICCVARMLLQPTISLNMWESLP